MRTPQPPQADEFTEGINAKLDWNLDFFIMLRQFQKSESITEFRVNLYLLEAHFAAYLDEDYNKDSRRAFDEMKNHLVSMNEVGVGMDDVNKAEFIYIIAKLHAIMKLANRLKITPQRELKTKVIGQSA